MSPVNKESQQIKCEDNKSPRMSSSSEENVTSEETTPTSPSQNSVPGVSAPEEQEPQIQTQPKKIQLEEEDKEKQSQIDKSEKEIKNSEKKKSGSHIYCEICNKKLGLAMRFKCKCEKWFCTTHRYPEAHKCTYEWKEDGRKRLAKENPIIVAPKITKI